MGTAVLPGSNFEAFSFVDVFGGSGAACVAIPKKDRVTYYYNEKNRSVENLFSVLADEQLHQELIVELEKTVKHMKRGRAYRQRHAR